MVIGLLAGVGLSRANAASIENTNTIHYLQRRAVQLDHVAAKSPAELQTALHSISVETGVPQDQIQAQRTAYPKATVGQLLFVNVIAAETKKDPQELLKELFSGKTWLAIAEGNKVNLNKLKVRYDNVVKEMAGVK
jgi:hypothetical protein